MNGGLQQQLDLLGMSSAGLLLLILLLWEGVRPFFAFFRARAKERALHGMLNLLLWGCNAVLIAFLLASLWQATASWSAANGFGLLRMVNMPVWASTCVAVLVFDFWTYWWHRMSHRIRFLWRFHRVHHSDPNMDVTTAVRFHFGEIIMSSLLRVPILLILGAAAWQLALYEVIMFPVVLLHHANVALPEPMDRLLRIFVASPFMHKVHHSRLRVETDSNYTSFLSVWDRLFQSFKLKDDYAAIDFGLKEFDDQASQTLAGMLKTPLA